MSEKAREGETNAEQVGFFVVHKKVTIFPIVGIISIEVFRHFC